jgi:hypothetical protein
MQRNRAFNQFEKYILGKPTSELNKAFRVADEGSLGRMALAPVVFYLHAIKYPSAARDLAKDNISRVRTAIKAIGRVQKHFPDLLRRQSGQVDTLCDTIESILSHAPADHQKAARMRINFNGFWPCEPMPYLKIMEAELLLWNRALKRPNCDLFYWHFAQLIAALGLQADTTELARLLSDVLERAGIEKSRGAILGALNRMIKSSKASTIVAAREGKRISEISHRLTL